MNYDKAIIVIEFLCRVIVLIGVCVLIPLIATVAIAIANLLLDEIDRLKKKFM